MATSKSKKAKKSTEKPKNTNTKPEVTVIEEIVTVTEPETIVTEKAKVKEFKKNKNIFANFFAKKGDPEENILTIFKSPRIWGALAGELIGTMFITILLLEGL